MKNNLFLFALLFVATALFSSANSQVTQASFIGTWKMNPSNNSHVLSRFTIVDNGSSVTFSSKKTLLKKYSGKYDPQDRKLHVNIDGIDYFFVYVPANGSLMGYTTSNNTKFADYIKQ